MDLKAILFDKDGTLFDFHATWSDWAAGAIRSLAGGDEALAGELAAALEYDLAAQVFYPGSRVIAGTLGEQAEALARTALSLSAEEIVAQLITLAQDVGQVEVVPLAPFMAALRSDGYALAVVTNDAERAARTHLDRAGVSAAFDLVLGYDSGHGAKPDPAPLWACAAAMGLPAGACAMVGDSTHDLHAARAAGMVAVGVLTGPARAEDLASYADAVLPSIAALPAWLAR